MPKFPLDSKTNVILLDGRFTGPRTTRTIKMVLDTGASVTTVPSEIALAIGIDPTNSERRVDILTASGREFAHLIHVPKLSILGYSLKNVEVACLNLPMGNLRIRGLLGLNVLKEFDIFLKFRSKILEIIR